LTCIKHRGRKANPFLPAHSILFAIIIARRDPLYAIERRC
jgi:hypothetical protein